MALPSLPNTGGLWHRPKSSLVAPGYTPGYPFVGLGVAGIYPFLCIEGPMGQSTHFPLLRLASMPLAPQRSPHFLGEFLMVLLPPGWHVHILTTPLNPLAVVLEGKFGP